MPYMGNKIRIPFKKQILTLGGCIKMSHTKEFDIYFIIGVLEYYRYVK